MKVKKGNEETLLKLGFKKGWKCLYYDCEVFETSVETINTPETRIVISPNGDVSINSYIADATEEIEWDAKLPDILIEMIKVGIIE